MRYAPRRIGHESCRQEEGHCAIEGGSKQRWDTAFHEDGCDLHHGRAAHVFAALNNLVIGLVALTGFCKAAWSRRIFAGDPARALSLLVCAI